MSLIDDIITASLPGPLAEVFGDSVTYAHKPGNTVQTVIAIAADPMVEGSYPGSITLIEILRADLSPAATQGDQVTIGGVVYEVFDVKVDDVGPSGLYVRLALQKK